MYKFVFVTINVSILNDMWNILQVRFFNAEKRSGRRNVDLIA